MPNQVSKPAEKPTSKNPFPGLRPFNTNEAHLFFGREGQSEEVLANLKKNRFSAVLGASGSGKSSLIYCGLLPILYGGFLHNGRSKWRVITTRPGHNPIEMLAKSMAMAIGTKQEEEPNEDDIYINEAMLKRSVSGISNIIQQYTLNDDENVLILVDQFEELFRFQHSSTNHDALNITEHFVNLLCNAQAQTTLPIYIVLTMRSDFIGECSPFQNLTKLINDSHYLIPRMTREDYRKAITGPIAVGGAKISPQLVQLLLNEMGNNPDELPIMQHALMRTWEYWTKKTDTLQPIGIEDYEAIGRMEHALSIHANEAYDELDYDHRKSCEIIFKSITEKGADNRGIRRPTTVRDLASIAQTSPQQIAEIVDIFRSKGRTFLTPAWGTEITEESYIDISHESLMRVWDKLKNWVEEETSAVKMYKRLADSAELFDLGKTTLWGSPDLQLAISWREKQQPNLAWAVRHNPAFERTMVYLKTSEEEYNAEEENKIRLQKRAVRRTKIFSIVLGSAGMVAIALGILALVQRQDALSAQSEAEKQSTIATEQAEEAQKQRLLAQDNAEQAIVQKDSAEIQRQFAVKQTYIAQSNLQEANRQKKIAETKSREAKEQQKLAEANAKKALEQQQLALQASKEAERRRMLSISQSMAVKSEQLKTDTLLKGLLAFQAYSFNKEYNGTAWDPDVYKSVYYAIRLFEGEQFNLFEGHTSLIRTILQHNSTLYTGGSDGKLIQWDMGSRQGKVLNSNLSIVKKIGEQNKSILGVTDNRFFTYNTDSEASDLYIIEPNIVKDFFVTSDNKLLLVYTQSISLTNSYKEIGKTVFSTTARINATKYYPKNDLIIVATSDGNILEISNITNTTPTTRTIVNEKNSNWGDIAYNAGRNLVAAGLANSQGLVYIWDAENGNLKNLLRGHSAKISGVAFSSNDSLLATASYDGSVRLWHLDDLNTLPIVLDDQSNWCTAVYFSPNNKYVFTGDKNGNIRQYPVDITALANKFCGYLQRKMSTEEWNSYVGSDIPYKPNSCK